MQEASLTGESEAADERPEVVPAEAGIGDRHGMLLRQRRHTPVLATLGRDTRDGQRAVQHGLLRRGAAVVDDHLEDGGLPLVEIARPGRPDDLRLSSAEDATEVATQGVRAVVEGHPVRVGKLDFIQEVDPAAYLEPLGPGQTAVAVSVGDRFAGSLMLRDVLRENAADTVRVLRESGIEHVAMLTGDHQQTARSLGAAAGIEEVHAHLLPEDKVRLIDELPGPVVMVGGGINDAPVLAAADVGIAMGARGSTAASESADVVIMRDDVGKAVQAIDIGRDTYRVALTSIWIGVGLSVGLMIVAAFGYIPAVWGALTQEVVDLVVIVYALRALTGSTSHPELLLPQTGRPEPATAAPAHRTV